MFKTAAALLLSAVANGHLFANNLHDVATHFEERVAETQDRLNDHGIDLSQIDFDTLSDDISAELTHKKEHVAELIEEAMPVSFSDVNNLLNTIEAGPPPGFGCVTRHCHSQVQACLADNVCKENFACAGGCDPTNSTCTFYCSESYKSSSVDNLMHCMFEEHQCVTLPPPDAANNATCRDPVDAVVSGINKKAADGQWYVNYGYNTEYDCFACQLLSYEFNLLDQMQYEAFYELRAVNGSIIWNDVVMNGEEETPGIVTLRGEENGFDQVQHFYFLINELDTMMVYYCGDLLDYWHFEGVLLMSKSGSFNTDRIDQVTRKLEDLELTWYDLCVLDPSGECHDVPPHVLIE